MRMQQRLQMVVALHGSQQGRNGHAVRGQMALASQFVRHEADLGRRIEDARLRQLGQLRRQGGHGSGKTGKPGIHGQQLAMRGRGDRRALLHPAARLQQEQMGGRIVAGRFDFQDAWLA